MGVRKILRAPNISEFFLGCLDLQTKAKLTAEILITVALRESFVNYSSNY